MIQNKLVGVSLFAALLGAFGSGCSTQGGKLAAVGTGDLSAPPAPRGSHAALLVDACGDGQESSRGASELQREPYLQQVTARSAEIMLVDPQTEGVIVDVTTPAGEAVASITAQADASGGVQVAKVDGLDPSTIYCYSLRGLSTPTGFVTAPATGSDALVRFIAFGDSGDGSDKQLTLLGQMEDVPFDFIVHTGDIAYEDGTEAQLQRTFFDVYAPLLKNHAAFPASGNHDYATRSGAAVWRAFSLPDNGIPGASERYYSYDWGDVHFVALDTEKLTDAEVAWVEDDLRHNAQPWTVVYGHHPAFSSGMHGSTAKVQDKLVPLFERYAVSLVLGGHDHDYERTVPIHGVTYVVTGGGGRGTRSLSPSEFTAFAEDVLHFVYVEVEGETLTLHAIDAVGREFDSLILHKR